MYRVVVISRGPASAQQVTQSGALLRRAQPGGDQQSDANRESVKAENAQPARETGLARKPAARRRSKSGKVPRGLGRGLAGILDSERKTVAESGGISGALSLLLGADAGSSATDLSILNKIHKFVIDAAVTAMVDGFRADGAVVASRSVAAFEDRVDQLPNLSLRVPPSCNVSSPLLFAVYGQLSQLLEADPNVAAEQSGQRQIGDTWVWFYRVENDRIAGTPSAEQGTDGDLGSVRATVAATFRSTPFEQWETDALSSLVASVAFTLGGSKRQVELRRRLRAGTSVEIVHVAQDTKFENEAGSSSFSDSALSDSSYGNHAADDSGQAVRAEVSYAGTVDGLEAQGEGFVAGAGVGADAVAAVAAAAAEICQGDRQVVFAGSSEVGGHTVTIVMMTEAGTRPRLGVAVHEPGDLKGVAEAVLTTVI